MSEPSIDVREWVRSATGREVRHVVPLAGGLSPRRFFRVELADGERRVAMWLPPDSPERRLGEARGRLSFVEVRELLETRGVRVPRLDLELAEHGLLLVEDLGETLAERIARSPELTAPLYRRAVETLAFAQRALAELPRGSIVLDRSFDATLLTWELDHFREWGIEAVSCPLTTEERLAFERVKARVVERILAQPYGFCHRDYQSRNLMVPGAEPEVIAWIDFQDALLGPRAYDLVALLCDSYQRFEGAFVEERLGEYSEARGLATLERRQLREEFDWITVQRKLKDAGRFVFFDRTRGDSSYLRYFEPSLERVLTAIERLLESGDEEALRSLHAVVDRQRRRSPAR